MNLLALAPTWLIALLYGLLVLAALEDGWRMRISNWTSGAIAVAAFVAVGLAGPISGLWQNLALFVGVLAVGTLLFSRKIMGGGDIKLLAAAALWCNLSAGWKMLVAVAIAGGIEALLLILLRKLNWSEAAGDRFPMLRRRGGIPYGIAIAAGVILVAWWLRARDYVFYY
jgi:prepilin peptidase CpaA